MTASPGFFVGMGGDPRGELLSTDLKVEPTALRAGTAGIVQFHNKIARLFK